MNKKEEINKFNEFIFYIDDLLDEITEKSREQGFTLDLSLESLKDLAQFIRQNEIKNDKENLEDFLNCWVYLGEVFRHQAEGADWTVGLDNPKNINYGLYYLSGYDTDASEFIPILYVNNFVLSSKEELDDDFFCNLVQQELNPVIPNLDNFPTEEE